MDIPWFYYLFASVIAVRVALTTKKWSVGLLTGYLFLFLAMTVFTRPVGAVRYQLLPFWSYRDYFNGTDPNLMRQIIGNVLIFIPVGILSGIWKGWKGVWIGEGFSAFVEIAQLITRRGFFEFDDTIHNTFGTLLGVVMVLMPKKVRNMRIRG